MTGTPVEILMFGPHDVAAGHELAIDVTAAITEAVVKMGCDGLPPYYVVLGLTRCLARIGVCALPGYSDGLIPMLQKALEQERASYAKAVQQ